MSQDNNAGLNEEDQMPEILSVTVENTGQNYDSPEIPYVKIQVEGSQQSSVSSLPNSSLMNNTAICRICYDDATNEALASYCLCIGSMGLVHKSCLEKWLGCSSKMSCEICRYKFKVKKEPKTFSEYLKIPKKGSYRRNLIADAVCFFILTPIALVSVWLCCRGINFYQNKPQGGRWEMAGLVTLDAFILLVHSGWCAMAIRYHLRMFQSWKRQNQNVTLLSSNKRKSRTTDSASVNNNNLDIDSSALPSSLQRGGFGLYNTMFHPLPLPSPSALQWPEDESLTSHDSIRNILRANLAKSTIQNDHHNHLRSGVENCPNSMIPVPCSSFLMFDTSSGLGSRPSPIFSVPVYLQQYSMFHSINGLQMMKVFDKGS